MGSPFTDHELFRACRELFGPEVEISAEFIDYIQPAGVKTAFRQRVKAIHPDLLPSDLSGDGGKGHEPFLQLHAAYTLVTSYLVQNRIPEQRNHRRKSSPSAGRHDGNFPDEGPPAWTLPKRRLPLGRYLYYLGIISYRTLLNAITWQRHSTPRLGVLARDFGWLSHHDVAKILSSSEPGLFGQRAVRTGLLSERQLKQLLLQQRISRRRIGEFFVGQGIISKEELEVLIKGLWLHNARQRE